MFVGADELVTSSTARFWGRFRHVLFFREGPGSLLKSEKSLRGSGTWMTFQWRDGVNPRFQQFAIDYYGQPTDGQVVAGKAATMIVTLRARYFNRAAALDHFVVDSALGVRGAPQEAPERSVTNAQWHKTQFVE